MVHHSFLTSTFVLCAEVRPCSNTGDFQIFHILNNLTTLDGGATATVLESTQPSIYAWHKAMMELPAIAAHLAARPQPGSGEIGKPGSLIFKYKEPHAKPSAKKSPVKRKRSDSGTAAAAKPLGRVLRSARAR